MRTFHKFTVMVGLLALAPVALAAVPTVIYSSIASSPTSDVPGLPGVKFGSTLMATLQASPSGNWWVLDAYTDGPSTENEVFLFGSGMTGSIMAREGTACPWNPSLNYEGLDDLCGITNAGTVAFSGDLSGDTNTDDFIACYSGGTATAVALEGGDASSVFGAGVTWDALDSAQITNDGRVGFRATSIDGLPGGTDTDAAYVLGNTVLAQEGITVPAGQAGGAAETWDIFDIYDFRVDGTGDNYLIQGDLHGSSTGDDVLVVNGKVVLQEDSLADPSFTSSISTIGGTGYGYAMDNQYWLARGGNDDGQDWVVGDVGQGKQLLAAVGDPIFTGASESFDDTPYSQCFFMDLANNNGDYIIAGLTDIGDEWADAVLVLNGTEVILRQGDAVDLDGNGLLDDGVYIDTCRNDDVFLTDDLHLYLLVSLMDANHDPVGQAFLVYAIPEPGTLSLLLIGGLALLRRR